MSIGVFAVFLGGIGLALVVGERSTIGAGDRVSATFVAEEALEAVRHMALKNFSSVTAGIHGLKLINGAWTFTGSSVMMPAGYRARVNIINKGTDWLQIDAFAQWDFGQTRSGSVVISSYLTNWRKTLAVGNWAAMTRVGVLNGSGTPEYQKIAVSGNYAFVSSLVSGGGKGLYVFDITTPTAPVRVATSFDLGAPAYGLTVSGDRLYVTTGDNAKELQVFDIGTPASLTGGSLLKSYDVPGNGKARAVSVYDATIFVGALHDAANPHFYSLRWSESEPIELLDSLSASGGVLDIALREGYAYVATTSNAGELQVIDVFDPEHLAFAPGTGIDMTEVFDASAINVSGTSALIGRLNGSTIDEFSLYSVADSPVPVTPPGPWSLEIGGDVLSLASIFGSKYAFVGGSAASAQLRVIDLPKLAAGSSPIVNTYNAGAQMRGLYYDWQKDRLFGVTPSSLMVFTPG